MHKIYDTWLEINLAVIKNNYKKLLKRANGKEILAVLKANAYNAGIQEVAKALNEVGCNKFGVYNIEEAKQILSVLPTKEILIMSAVRTERIKEASKLGLSLSVSNSRILDFIISNKIKTKIHLKIDTGMGRGGFRGQKALDVIEKIVNCNFIEKEGIYTHFSSAVDEEYVEYQLNNFKKLEKYFKFFNYVHAQSTTSFLLNNLETLNLARIGGALYGLSPYDIEQINELDQALTLKSRIEYIDTIPSESFIGYDKTYKTTKETRVALISAGYAQGVDRGLSNRGYFLVKGYRCPILGVVSMNNTLVEIPEDVSEDDEVIIFGNDLPLFEISKLGNKRIYELLFSLNVNKIYLEE